MLHPLDEIEKKSYLNRIIFLFVNKLVPIFYYLKLTPNLITSISLYFCYYSYQYLISRNLNLQLLYYWCYVILDYCDGFMARKYDMVTQFGDFFDHFRDDVFHSYLLFEVFTSYLYTKQYTKLFYIFLYIVYYSIKTVITFGYQEHKIYNAYKQLAGNGLEIYNKERKSIMWSRNCAPKYNYILELYYKYIGTCGMFIDVSLLIIYFIRASQCDSELCSDPVSRELLLEAIVKS
jgi:phosphatidylglycerophosphate synthase